MSNTNGSVYRFTELNQQHQITLLRQAVLQREQQLYGIAMQQQALEASKLSLLDELRRLQAEIQMIVAPTPEGKPGDPVEFGAPAAPAEEAP